MSRRASCIGLTTGALLAIAGVIWFALRLLKVLPATDTPWPFLLIAIGLGIFFFSAPTVGDEGDVQ